MELNGDVYSFFFFLYIYKITLLSIYLYFNRVRTFLLIPVAVAGFRAEFIFYV